MVTLWQHYITAADVNINRLKLGHGPPGVQHYTDAESGTLQRLAEPIQSD
jgi:hypothetical protein